MPCSEHWGQAMRRRDFINAVAGVAAVWPLSVRAQQPEQVRRIGVLMNIAENDPEAAVQIAALVQALKERGWILGTNIQIEYRWAAGDSRLYRRYAPELVALALNVILVVGGTGTGELQRATSTIPIVFVGTTDPVNRGLIESMARPGGNTTGFIEYEFGLSGKWLELLKQIAPKVSRVMVVRDPSETSGIGQLTAIQTLAPSFGVETAPVDARDGREIERTVSTIARNSNVGLIVTLSGAAISHRKLLITLAAQHRLPAVYPARYFVEDGGLASYGPDPVNGFRSGASYVDRILKGEKPADLPVQAPTKYELAFNLKTAKALDLEVPPSFLASADEVIE
jgi:putative tryptophan/tyrosine transport system substrate-binding protein